MKRIEAIDLIVHDMALAHAAYQRKLYYDVYKELRDGVLARTILDRHIAIGHRYRIMYEASPETTDGDWRHSAGWYRVQRSMSTADAIVEYVSQVLKEEA